MKTAHTASSILIGLSILLTAGCKSTETASNAGAKPNSVASSNSRGADNSNQSAQPSSSPSDSGASSNAKPGSPPQLIGTYESREVESEGVVTLMSQLKTLFLFSSDGTYSRESQVNGKAYHSDSGTFRIQPPDKLILSIQVTGLKTQRKVQSPPLTKTHKFSLSADGDELKLIADKGKTAVFKRLARPKNP